MGKSDECTCTDAFTCGYCLRNTKPLHYTLSDGSVIYVTVPIMGVAAIEAGTCHAEHS